MDNKRIQTSDLDFDTIKENLKNYLRGQSEFSDYDFEGSGLSILIDVLAYNTHYDALYHNLAINEAFIDSASKRASVVSRAKELGYVPQSARSATAIVNVNMINNQLTAPDSIEIPRYAQFNTSVDGVPYTFYTVESYVAFREGNQYQFSNVVLKEGTLLRVRREIFRENAVVIPNENVDLSTLRVTVQASGQTTDATVFVRSDNILDIKSDTPIYFVKENVDQLYEVEFGNEVVGRRLQSGNVVTIDYLVCNAEAANKARTFAYAGPVPSGTQPFTVTVSPAFGGSAPESIENIKWNAPRAYAAQNRCVTLDDYRTIITSLYPNARSINVWGGEQNNPPSYGDVFISVRPEDREALTEQEKDLILSDIIEPRKIVTLHPKFVDAEFIRVEADITYYYQPNETTRLTSEISNIIREEVLQYNEESLDKFESILKFSTLSRLIDGAEPSIRSNITTLKLHCEIEPVFNRSVQYQLNIGNPIYKSGAASESVLSTGVNVLNIQEVCFIDDVPTPGTNVGILRLFYYIQSQKVVVRNIGTVDYSKGIITFDNLIITGLASPEFKFIIKPQSYDVASVRNQIVTIDPRLITIKPQQETSANTYKFTSSRN